MEAEGTPGACGEEGADETNWVKAEGCEGGGVGGGGVGQVGPTGVWLCGTVTGDGAGYVGGPLGDGEEGFCEMGDRVGMAMSGLGPAAFPEGLLIMTGGDSGRGVKLHADHTVDLGGGAAGPKVGGGAWGSVCCRLGTVA